MKHLEKTSTKERKIFRKDVRKTSNHTALGAFLLTATTLVLSAISVLILLAVSGLDIHSVLNNPADTIEILEAIPFVGLIDILAPFGGLLAVFLCFAKQGTHKQLLVKNKSMSLPILGVLICIMCLFDSVGVMIYGLTEQSLNLFGFSTSTGAAMAGNLGVSVTTLIASCFIAPVVEELVFRGFLLRRMEKHGKVTAIVVTSVLFGLMHQNLPQIMPAMMIGLVWGYVATEYSLGWSIVLHIFENLVRVTLLNNFLAGFSEQVQGMVRITLMAATGVIAIVILIRNREHVRTWIRENLQDKSTLIWALCAPAMILTIAYYIINTITIIEKIG